MTTTGPSNTGCNAQTWLANFTDGCGNAAIGYPTGTPTYRNLSAGTYTVTVTDANGCTATTSATVTEPPGLSLSASANPTDCNGRSHGLDQSDGIRRHANVQPMPGRAAPRVKTREPERGHVHGYGDGCERLHRPPRVRR
ncbi:MAG: PKD domain-containing protein [Lewinellaceae bacterium]|nr:PKD domain-containing protein [Lewinellaceae bacterium]